MLAVVVAVEAMAAVMVEAVAGVTAAEFSLGVFVCPIRLKGRARFPLLWKAELSSQPSGNSMVAVATSVPRLLLIVRSNPLQIVHRSLARARAV